MTGMVYCFPVIRSAMTKASGQKIATRVLLSSKNYAFMMIWLTEMVYRVEREVLLR